MGHFASQHGTAATVKKFSSELGSSKNAKLKCREFSKLQKCEIKMQRKISVLQYFQCLHSLHLFCRMVWRTEIDKKKFTRNFYCREPQWPLFHVTTELPWLCINTEMKFSWKRKTRPKKTVMCQVIVQYSVTHSSYNKLLLLLLLQMMMMMTSVMMHYVTGRAIQLIM